MIWKQRIGDELYVYHNGSLIFKRWIKLGYSMTFFAIALLTSLGCDALVPSLPDSGKATPPLPTPKSQVVELRITVDGEGKISLGGAGSVDVRSEKAGAADVCVCGCSRPGCDCAPGAELSTTKNVAKTEQAAASIQKRHAVYFTASWCGPCRTFGPRLKVLADKHNLKIRTIDVDQNPTAWQPFAVRDNQIPQVVFFDGDTFLESIVQPTDEQILKALGVK